MPSKALRSLFLRRNYYRSAASSSSSEAVFPQGQTNKTDLWRAVPNCLVPECDGGVSRRTLGPLRKTTAKFLQSCAKSILSVLFAIGQVLYQPIA